MGRRCGGASRSQQCRFKRQKLCDCWKSICRALVMLPTEAGVFPPIRTIPRYRFTTALASEQSLVVGAASNHQRVRTAAFVKCVALKESDLIFRCGCGVR